MKLPTTTTTTALLLATTASAWQVSFDAAPNCQGNGAIGFATYMGVAPSGCVDINIPAAGGNPPESFAPFDGTCTYWEGTGCTGTEVNLVVPVAAGHRRGVEKRYPQPNGCIGLGPPTVRSFSCT